MQQMSMCQPSVTRLQAREHDVLPEREQPCGAGVRAVINRSLLFSFTTGQIPQPGNMNTTHGNIMCGGHRRHSCRSADRMAKIVVSQTQHVYQHCLFRSNELYLPQNRVSCVLHCKIYNHGQSLAIPVYVVTTLAGTKACKQLSPRKLLRLTLDHFPCQTKTDVSLIQSYGRKLYSMFSFAGHRSYNTVTSPQLRVCRIRLPNKQCNKCNNKEVRPCTKPRSKEHG